MSSKGTCSDHYDGRKGQIMRMGYLRKLKTMKKKFFILRGESTEASARLEYYDSEKKWRNSEPPKRTISLKTCFNINRRKDTKHKFVIALYTKDDCFCMVLDSEEDLQEWLKVLLKLQTGEDCVDGEQPKPNFDHMWKVTLQEKGLGDSKNLVGPYHVCLTDSKLTLVKITEDDAKPETLEFPLIYIRSCGVTGSFFYIEVGRQTVTGAGALWMLTEDANIAKNMNAVIFSAFSLQQKDQKDVNFHRKRSSSATESSKSSSILQRRQNQVLAKPLPSTGYSAVPVASSLVLSSHGRPSVLQIVSQLPSQRRHSVSAMSSNSATRGSTLKQPPNADYTVLSPNFEISQSGTGPLTLPIVHQRTKSCPITESSVSSSLMSPSSPSDPQKNISSTCSIHQDKNDSKIPNDVIQSPSADGIDNKRNSMICRKPMTRSSSTCIRERSDRISSRNRTTSEGAHYVTAGILSHSYRIPFYGSRPHSVHSRGPSRSPPVVSGPCSIDSAGSSVSIDEADLDVGILATSPRYAHSLTPDEPVIIEENSNDYCLWGSENETTDIANDYVVMARPTPSRALPIHRKISAPASFKSNSPLHSFMDVCSPCGSSPLEEENYLPMSPVKNTKRTISVDSMHSSTHNRNFKLPEETPDGYVPMAPLPTDEGYVDMEPLLDHRGDGEGCHHSDMSPGSSCSFTSGTPSTDLKFSEYHLEKVSSYLTPSEDDEISLTDRPPRTYSFGSKSETIKNKEIGEASNCSDSGRVRALSVGSKMGRPRILTKELLKPVLRNQNDRQNSKSSSAPLLNTLWSGRAKYSQSSSDPMADLMEIDFSENKKKKKKRSITSKFRVAPVAESYSQFNVDLKNSNQTVTSSTDSGYMDMSFKSPSGSTSITRDRSDSMPSRNRSVSKGVPLVTATNLPHLTRMAHPPSRPHAIHARVLSRSPPYSLGPCSADCAESSVSLDEKNTDIVSLRYVHSSTTEEPVIIEEITNDYCQCNPKNDSENDYVLMAKSETLPVQIEAQRKISAPASLKSSSFPHSSVDVIDSAESNSNNLQSKNYLIMTPTKKGGAFTSKINRTSNPNNKNNYRENDDGYVPMAPNQTDDGYVDMENLSNHRLKGDGDCQNSDLSPGNSCPYSSGTLSTDLKFSEYHLEKVSSYLMPSEEDEISPVHMPARTYSFGSKSEKSKKKVETVNSAEGGRARAFSVGSKWGKPKTLMKEMHRPSLKNSSVLQNTKSSSTPLLSGSWSETSKTFQFPNDPMGDHMEIDFTENKKKKKRNFSSKIRVTPVMETASRLSLDVKKPSQKIVSGPEFGYMDMSFKSPPNVFSSKKSQSGIENNSTTVSSVISKNSSKAQGFNALFGKSPPKPSSLTDFNPH